MNQWDEKTKLIPFTVANENYGFLKESFFEKLKQYSTLFSIIDEGGDEFSLSLHNSVLQLSREEKTQLIHRVSLNLCEEGLIAGWRNEFVPVKRRYSQPPCFLIERALYSHFGLKGYGVHVNGFVRDETGSVSHLWVATRSRSKSTFPGMLDHIVAGGQPHGISPSANVVKECAEEAGIPADLAASAISVGAVSYSGLDASGNLKRDVLMCYDLEMPRFFVPRPVDGEVERFELRSVEWVFNRVLEGGPTGYKPNCNLVIIDFFIRHGLISSDTPGYLDIVNGLRSGECT